MEIEYARRPHREAGGVVPPANLPVSFRPC